MENLTENLLNERHSVVSIIARSPEETTTQWIWIMRNGAMGHSPPKNLLWPTGWEPLV